MPKILKRLEVGGVKWSTKAAISLKRVKMDEKLLWRAYRNALSGGTIPYHLCTRFPRLKGAQNSNRYISGTDKFTDFKFGPQINSAHAN